MLGMNNKPLSFCSVWFGTDPELFLQNSAGQVVGSEAAVPAEEAPIAAEEEV